MIDRPFEEILVGDEASFIRQIIEEDVAVFSRLSGDKNPLHIDEAYAAGTKLGGRVAHGMFLASLISCLVGVHLPGKRSLLLSLEVKFKSPARIGDILKIEGAVVSRSQATRIVEVEVKIKKDHTILVEGVAKVQML
jgi:3-hydroxybutyryl-CoA dehydratase